ncbi:MAG: hypothetical protein WC111_10320 [Candidatus Cloacimonadaceae bacterium]|jgi:hypothetical protein
MQFRIQGQRIQCIRSTYDSEIKRSRQKVVASFDKWTDKMPSAGLDDFTDEEREEFAHWLSQRAEEQAANSMVTALLIADSNIARISEAVGSEHAAEVLDEARAAKIWTELVGLQKALRGAGYPRPKASKAKPVTAAAGQGDLLD